MRVLKDDFKSGQPASSIGADWLNAVANFINKLTGSNGIRINREGQFPSVMIDATVSAMGTPVDNTNISEGAEMSSSLNFTNWTAGGENGLKIRLYGLVEDGGGAHILQPVDIDIAANGIVKSVKAPTGELGILIGA